MILPLSFRLFFSAFIVSASPLSADSRGLAIYQKHCLECHGKDGSGDEDTDPFEGSRSLAWLTGKI
ncbi:MAG: cytochrome c, partial [Verrucomicrobiota bacterium]